MPIEPTPNCQEPARNSVFRVGNHRIAWRPSPLLMGVVNVTPDSFSDGGRYLGTAAALQHALRLVEDGADMLDIGGESSRPGATPVALDEEIRRVVPLLEELRPRVEIPLSIDTTKAEVARRALDLGVDIVNDIGGMRLDPGMLTLLAGSQCGVVLMHMLGEPRTMQDEPRYADVTAEVGAWLGQRVEELRAAGIAAERVVIDPGIGFGKRYADNLELLRHLDGLRSGGRPLLVGASRKRFLGWLLDEPQPDQRLEGDLAIAAFCRAAGVEILRVHDVRATRRLFNVLDALDGVLPPELSLDQKARSGG